MHSPETVAHEINIPWFKGKKIRLFTIWHNDPETDGTDDSCGWFIRGRHADQDMLEKIKKDFEFEYKHNYWFDESGKAKFSASGILLNMYQKAAWVHFKHDRKKMDRFFRKHLHEILLFAENPTDCGGDNITNRWNSPDFKERMSGMASMVYTDILRKIRPWYKHPRWHVHHWSIQFHPWQNLKRRYWDKCCKCGKRGFKTYAIGNWDGTMRWHPECEGNISGPVQEK